MNNQWGSSYNLIWNIKRGLWSNTNKWIQLKVDVDMLSTVHYSTLSLWYKGGYSGGRVVSTSASHQCGPGSIPGWGPDPSVVSEKGFVPVWATCTLHLWVGTLSCWPTVVSQPSLTQYEGFLCVWEIGGDFKELTLFSKRVGESPRCCDPSSSIYIPCMH